MKKRLLNKEETRENMLRLGQQHYKDRGTFDKRFVDNTFKCCQKIDGEMNNISIYMKEKDVIDECEFTVRRGYKGVRGTIAVLFDIRNYIIDNRHEEFVSDHLKQGEGRQFDDGKTTIFDEQLAKYIFDLNDLSKKDASVLIEQIEVAGVSDKTLEQAKNHFRNNINEPFLVYEACLKPLVRERSPHAMKLMFKIIDQLRELYYEYKHLSDDIFDFLIDVSDMLSYLVDSLIGVYATKPDEAFKIIKNYFKSFNSLDFYQIFFNSLETIAILSKKRTHVNQFLKMASEKRDYFLKEAAVFNSTAMNNSINISFAKVKSNFSDIKGESL